MAVVVDANLVVVLATRDSRVTVVERHLQSLSDEGEDLRAPTLLTYEVANALTRLVVAGELTAAGLDAAWELAERMPIEFVPMPPGREVIRIALRLRRSNAYDAAYIALAQQLGTELWTLDGSLARNAAGLGYPVRFLE